MTTENVAEQDAVESAAVVSTKAVDDQLIDELVSRAQVEGLRLTGEGGLLQQHHDQLLIGHGRRPLRLGTLDRLHDLQLHGGVIHLTSRP
ncbi:hypothetical protein [Streptomyces fagopyri]|uniref:hypothetical protein n=1 Tax=Streptomyces fagopyri TaxID=2662397 RepID=UPI0037217452